MIKSIWIDNFKSLVDFTFTPDKFTCLVGLNGSGKSTVLQCMDFLSSLMKGNLEEWLKSRQWDSSDINSKLTPKSNIDFKIVVNTEEFGEIVWSGSFNRKNLNCTKERIQMVQEDLLRVDGMDCAVVTPAGITSYFPIVFKYQGSILSSLKEIQYHGALAGLKKAVLEIRSLDLLSPESLRSRVKVSGGELGLGGKKLSAFIHESGKEFKGHLKNMLSEIYTHLESIDTKSLRSGWKQLEIVERYSGQKLRSNARHVNDGMLRLMAVLAQLEIGREFLLFDEIENGINPELIEFLIDNLVNSNHQIIVTTHSPLILNYLEDDIAKKGVIYLYKTEEGYTRAIKLFDIPSMSKNLEVMGPGEVFVDTNLTELYQEIESIL